VFAVLGLCLGVAVVRHCEEKVHPSARRRGFGMSFGRVGALVSVCEVGHGRSRGHVPLCWALREQLLAMACRLVAFNRAAADGTREEVFPVVGIVMCRSQQARHAAWDGARAMTGVRSCSF
jgi:hypothetical protein